MNSRFPLLSFLSLVLRILGFLVLLPGLWTVMKEGFETVNVEDQQFSQEDAIHLVAGVLAIFIGLASMAFGEIIGVLFAIEANTRNTSKQ